MSILYYTITHEQLKGQSVAYILRVFIEKDSEATCLETRVFPITNPQNFKSTYDRADLYGKLTVADLKKGGAK